MGLAVERLSEGRWVPPWIRHQHIQRYEWASQWTAGCIVVDAACGSGYGAKMLADAGARQVTGFDLSAEATEEARRLHGSDRVRFETADATQLPIADHSCDVYVSLETIEHIENDQAFVAEAARILRPGGKFICSTPNRSLTNPGISIQGKPFNPYHVREYTAEELQSLLRASFHSVDLFGQSLYAKSYAKMLKVAGGIYPMLAVRLHQVRKVVGIPWERPRRHTPIRLPQIGMPEVLIAVCTAY